MNPTGAARVEINIIDYSTLIQTALKGITGYVGVTERGVPGRLYNIGSWEEYQLELGGLLAGNDFPHYCKRTLDAGGRLVICPAGKYINPTDVTTLSGVKASLAQTQSSASAAGATAAGTVGGAATATGTVSVIVKVPGAADITIASAVAVTSGDSANTIAAAIDTAVNAGTSTHNFSSANSSSPTFTVTAPTSYGAWGRNLRIEILPSDPGITFSAYTVNFSGGADATTTSGTATWTAKAKGTGYNKVSVTATTAASNDQTKYDIRVSISDGTVPDEIYLDVPKLGSNTAIADFAATVAANSRLLSSVAISSAYVFQPFSTALTGGTDGTALTATDYIGNSTAKTNMYAFDNSSDITKICIPAIADGALAKLVADYCDSRKDIMGLHRTPTSITPDKALEYRLGTGSYSHTRINSWRNLMFYGDIKVVDPRTNLDTTIHAIGDIAGVIASKDNTYAEWFSFAGDKRGVLRNVLGLVTNVGNPAYASKADLFDTNGIIPVIQDAKGVIKIWGNSTLYQTASMLRKAEVAELVVFLFRTMRELIPLDMFDPNDPITWKNIYRRVQPFMEYLKAERAIWDYLYQGDQDITNISEAVVNKPADIDAGKYRLRLLIQPKVSMKYIQVDVILTNSGVDFTEIQ